MSKTDKHHLRNVTNTLSKSSSSSSSSSTSSSFRSGSATSHSPPNNRTMPNNNNNKLEFKPISNSSNYFAKQEHKKPSTSSGSGWSAKVVYGGSTSKSANRFNEILHSTAKSNEGKVHKRTKQGLQKQQPIAAALKKMANYGLVECFNLNEKEKYQQLLAQNLYQPRFNSNFTSKNAYNQFVRSSPTKIRDDIILGGNNNNNGNNSNKGSNQGSKNESQIEKYNLLASTSIHNKVSKQYTRRISVAGDLADETWSHRRQVELPTSKTPTNLSQFKVNRSRLAGATTTTMGDDSIIEIIQQTSTPSIGLSSSSRHLHQKVAQKRPPQINLADENADGGSSSGGSVIVVESFRPKASATQQMANKANRPLSDFEKRFNERMRQTEDIMEAIYKPQLTSKTFSIEEERYKLKKRQRLERERVEKELCKFTERLQLDYNLLPKLYFPEEEKIDIEDDFPELTEEQENAVNAALIHYPPDEVLVNGFGAGITRKDIQTLRGLNWLNDEIINFYMSLVSERSTQDDASREIPRRPEEKKCHAFSTFFYPKLLKDGYNSLRRWTRKVDIFSLDLVLVPIHLGLHWTLAVIDFNCHEIRYYDSMNGFNNECLKSLKGYLLKEYADKKEGAQFDMSSWNCLHVRDVPQQMNGSDCGMFTCKYAEYLSRGRNEFNFNQSHMPYFRRRMIWEILNKKLM